MSDLNQYVSIQLISDWFEQDQLKNVWLTIDFNGFKDRSIEDRYERRERSISNWI